MTTLFISDLHLEDARPQTTKILLDFLASETCLNADNLYILGDLFEFWIGDDVITETARVVAEALKSVSELGVRVYFMHGNRDFLLGESYADSAGMTLLPETTVISLNGDDTVLLHGDTMCTDDTAYQAFRQQVRNKEWQQSFLAMPLVERLEMARSARDASMQHTASASQGIMDVNESAVTDVFANHNVMQMIHGHTHRPAVHQHSLTDGSLATRTVLADWYETGTALQVGPDGRADIPLG
jgi:UDP-2,3-diacylglucosamine hydrolase